MWSFLGKVFLGHKRWECVLGWAAIRSWLSPWVKLSICWSGRACAELYKQSGWIRGQSWGHRLAADPSLISLLSDLYLINTLPSAKVSNTCAEHGAPVWGQPAHVLLLRFNRFKHFNWNSSSKLTDMMLKYAKNKQPKKQKQTPAQLGCLLVSVKGGVTRPPRGRCTFPSMLTAVCSPKLCWWKGRGYGGAAEGHIHLVCYPPPPPPSPALRLQHCSVMELWGSNSRSGRICLGCKKKKKGVTKQCVLCQNEREKSWRKQNLCWREAVCP